MVLKVLLSIAAAMMTFSGSFLVLNGGAASQVQVA